MDRQAVLAAYDEQVRRQPDGPVERDNGVIRCVSSDGWSGVIWSDLDEVSADDAITAQIRRFAGRPGRWEWKHYSYDRPADLPDRLMAAGFVPEPVEALLVAEIAELARDAVVPGVQLVPVSDEDDVGNLVAVHEEVFGGNYSDLGTALLAGIRQQPSTAAAVVALADGRPIAAGRLEFHLGTEFASLWGGGTVPAWRGRGVFRAMVAQRAAVASARGFRYLQVDASADSRPILRRLGFVDLATTTPYVYSDARP